MNKILLATILAIFLMLGIGCVCAEELQSTSGHGGNDYNYYISALSHIHNLDIIEIDVSDFFQLASAVYDGIAFDLPEILYFSDHCVFHFSDDNGFDVDLPEIPYFPNPVIYH